jgi:hypothetical protein
MVCVVAEGGLIQWEDEDFEVESILDHADEDGKRFYLIKWQGWSHYHNSWEPSENLECPSVIAKYHTSLHSKANSQAQQPVKRCVPKVQYNAQIIKRRKVSLLLSIEWYSVTCE